jgi:hypothetical protein
MVDTRRTILFVIAVLLIGVGVGITRSPGPAVERMAIQPVDGIGAPGEPTEFRARLLRRNALGFVRGVPGVVVTFFLDGRAIGGAVTDARGDAGYDHVFERPGHFTVEARTEAIDGIELTTELLASVFIPGDRLAIVDVDRTLAQPRSKLDWYLRRFDEFEAAPGAGPALAELYEDRHIVYLTERGDRYAAATRAWLQAHDLPLGPVLYKTWDFYGGDLGTYKREILTWLTAKWSAAPIGLCDSSTEARLYNSVGVRPIFVGAPDNRVQPGGTLGVRGWPDLVDPTAIGL